MDPDDQEWTALYAVLAADCECCQHGCPCCGHATVYPVGRIHNDGRFEPTDDA
jgi:hypothetical protein